MTTDVSSGGRLRQRLARGPVVAPGCPDPLAARLANAAGAQAIYVSGLVTEAVCLGAPDIGYLTLTELVNHAARIVEQSSAPVICDADIGFVGGPVNIHRTVRELERAGIAALHLEDQEAPKRCPLIPGKRLLDRRSAAARIDVAARARQESEFIIIARTDADIVSLDEVIARCNLYLRAGADMAFPMITEVDGRPLAQVPPGEIMNIYASVRERIDGPTLWLGARLPAGFTTKDIAQLGYDLIIDAGSAFRAAVSAMRLVYEGFLSTGSTEECFEKYPELGSTTSADILKLLDVQSYVEIEARFDAAVADQGTANAHLDKLQ